MQIFLRLLLKFIKCLYCQLNQPYKYMEYKATFISTISYVIALNQMGIKGDEFCGFTCELGISSVEFCLNYKIFYS